MSDQRLFIVYTDIVGHTRLIDRIGAGFRPLRRIHDDLFRAAADEVGGAYCVVGTGDGFYAGFTSAAAALDAALSFRRRLAAVDWDQHLPERCKGPDFHVRARVGVHTGLVKVTMTGDKPIDFDGVPRNTCDKLCALAKGNQVVVSREVWDEIRLNYSNFSQLDHANYGFFKPKDCKEVVEVVAVADAGGDPGPRPEQPSEYAAVLFAYIDEALELVERLGEAKFEAEFAKLDAALRTAIAPMGAGVFVKRLGRDGFLVSFDADLDAVRAAIALRREVYGKYRSSSILTVLRMGIDAGSVHYEYGPQGRADVRDQPCNIAAKIAGKLAGRWQLLASDRVKKNAYARLAERDEYQWVSLGRKDPVGSGESFDVIDIRDTRGGRSERATLWVDLSMFLLQLGPAAQVLGPGVQKRLALLFDTVVGSCQTKPIKAEHPAGFYAVFEDVVEAFDAAIDLHEACVAEPWEKQLAGLKRRHRRDSLAAVSVQLGEVATLVVNGVAEKPEGPGVDQAREMQQAQIGPGVSVLVGNAMRQAVDAKLAALRAVNPELRAGRPTAMFGAIASPPTWPEAQNGRIWGVQDQNRAAGRANSPAVLALVGVGIVAILLLAAAVVPTVMQSLNTRKMVVGQQMAPGYEDATKNLADALKALAPETGKSSGPADAFRRRFADVLRDSRDTATGTMPDRDKQTAALPALRRIEKLARLAATDATLAGVDFDVLARDFDQLGRADKDILAGWSKDATAPEDWFAQVKRDYQPAKSVVDEIAKAGRAAQDAITDAEGVRAAPGLPEADRAQLAERIRAVQAAQKKLGQVRAVARYAKDAAGIIDDATKATDTLKNTKQELAAHIPKPVTAPIENKEATAAAAQLRADLADDVPLAINRVWRETAANALAPRLTGGDAKDQAAALADFEAIKTTLRTIATEVQGLTIEPIKDLPKSQAESWGGVYRDALGSPTDKCAEAFFGGCKNLSRVTAPDLARAFEAARAALRHDQEEMQQSVREMSLVQQALDAGATTKTRCDLPGGPQAVQSWYGTARRTLEETFANQPVVSDLSERLRLITDLDAASSLDELARALTRAAHPEAAATAWQRVGDERAFRARSDSAWLRSCEDVLDKAREVLHPDSPPEWHAAVKAMHEDFAKRVALCLDRAATPAAFKDAEEAWRRQNDHAKGLGVNLAALVDSSVRPATRLPRMVSDLRNAILDMDSARRANAKEQLDRIKRDIDERFAQMRGSRAQIERDSGRFPEAEIAAVQKAFECERDRSLSGGATETSDPAKLGPALSSRWRATVLADQGFVGSFPKAVRYEFTGSEPAELALSAGVKPGVNQLDFRLLTDAAGTPIQSGGIPAYMCTTAASIGLTMIQASERPGDFTLSRLIGGQFARTDDVLAPLGWRLDERTGIAPGTLPAGLAPPRVTAWLFRPGLDLWQNLMKLGGFNYLSAGAARSDLEPVPASPLQHIRADAALFIARTLGCRLPTEAEWQAAWAMEKSANPAASSPATWNLRDAQVRGEIAYLDGEVAARKMQAVRPPGFDSDKVRAADGAASKDPALATDDGWLYFAPVNTPVQPGTPGLFTHIVGNVATFVLDDAAAMEPKQGDPAVIYDPIAKIVQDQGDKVGVMGRSAFSKAPDGDWTRRDAPFRAAAQVQSKVFSDVGFRPVFGLRAIKQNAEPCSPSLGEALEKLSLVTAPH